MSKAKRIKLKVGVAVVKQRKILLVREKGNDFWFVPGGQVNPGETLEEALKREIREELNCNLKSKGLLGTYFEERPDMPGDFIAIVTYLAEIKGKITPATEIEEIGWFDVKEVLQISQAPNIPLTIEDLEKIGLM